jgi:energy-coupling factor transport system ATP-binding protein
MDAGRVVCDAAPEAFLEWALGCAPALVTPGARLLDGLGLRPAPGVKAARHRLRGAGLLPGPREPASDGPPTPRRTAALRLDRVWHELRNGPAILRSASIEIAEGEKVALMGRNGAGKSTVLRHAAGLMKPTRGKVMASGRVALLLQNPTDYLVHDTVAEEAPPAALVRAGLRVELDRNPRELSVGEKQRLALAIVLGEDANVVCLDEPTRGMGRDLKAGLAGMLRQIDAAVLVATHDPEFAVAFADRVILLADGAPIADGPTDEVLSGGTYFATETARILAGAALTPEQGIALLTKPQEVPV